MTASAGANPESSTNLKQPETLRKPTSIRFTVYIDGLFFRTTGPDGADLERAHK